jgi:hypothetical protein
MAYRNKTYVAFDGDTDINYYLLMKAWKQNDNSDFNFHDAHDIKQARDTSTEETIKRSLRERMANSKVFVLLVGEHTKNLYKFVRWEIDLAINTFKLPIIIVNLNDKRKRDDDRCPPIVKEALATPIPFKAKIMQCALEHWPSSHIKHQNSGKSGAYYYEDSVYGELGI